MNPSDPTEKGFFGALFDFSFTSFVTPKIIKFIFAAVVILTGLAVLVFVAEAFHQNAALGVVALVILAPIYFFWVVIWTRVGLEVVMAIFSIERSAKHVAQGTSLGQGGGQFSPFPAGPGGTVGPLPSPPAPAVAPPPPAAAPPPSVPPWNPQTAPPPPPGPLPTDPPRPAG